MKFHQLLIGCWLCVFYFGHAELAGAIPSTSTISGQLLDRNGQPAIYDDDTTLPAEIKFYGTKTDDNPFYTLETQAIIISSFFNIRFTPPAPLLTRDEAWYSLAIDADLNGLDEADLFAERFQFSSVPYALSAQPGSFFTTHHGLRNGASSPNLPLNCVMVAPFETPPGGVKFNRMLFFLGIAEPGNCFSFGIYDDFGKLVVSSGPIQMRDTGVSFTYLEIKHDTVKLEPSKIYFTGVARNSGKVHFSVGLNPVTLMYGIVSTSSATGIIPESIDLTRIESATNATAPPITLQFVKDETDTKTGTLRKNNTKKPEIRWIKPKYSDAPVKTSTLK